MINAELKSIEVKQQRILFISRSSVTILVTQDKIYIQYGNVLYDNTNIDKIDRLYLPDVDFDILMEEVELLKKEYSISN